MFLASCSFLATASLSQFLQKEHHSRVMSPCVCFDSNCLFPFTGRNIYTLSISLLFLHIHTKLLGLYTYITVKKKLLILLNLDISDSSSSASLNSVDSHCLLYIPTVIRLSRSLVNGSKQSPLSCSGNT